MFTVLYVVKAQRAECGQYHNRNFRSQRGRESPPRKRSQRACVSTTNFFVCGSCLLEFFCAREISMIRRAVCDVLCSVAVGELCALCTLTTALLVSRERGALPYYGTGAQVDTVVSDSIYDNRRFLNDSVSRALSMRPIFGRSQQQYEPRYA
jgi:hypothetical protein